MIEVACKSCGKRYRVDDKFAGRVVPCSACGDKISIIEPPPPEEDDQDTFEIVDPGEDPVTHTAFESSKAANTAPVGPPVAPVDDEDDDDDDIYAQDSVDDVIGLDSGEVDDDDDDDVYVEDDDAETAVPGAAALKGAEKETATIDEMNLSLSPLGLGAAVLAVVGFGVSFLHKLGSLPISGIGFVLGLIGLLLAIKQRRHGVRMPIAGLVLATIAFAAAVIMLATTETPVESAPAPTQTASQTTTDGDAAPTDAAPPPEPPPAQAGPVTAADALVRGSAEVSLQGVQIGPVTLRNNLTNKTESSTDVVLSVRVLIKNLSTSKVLEYQTWAGQPKGYKRDFGELVDQDGNGYRRGIYGEHTVPVGRVRKSSIAPGMSITDVLLFKRPPRDIKFLELMLPGENIGSDFALTFRIAADAIER